MNKQQWLLLVLLSFVAGLSRAQDGTFPDQGFSGNPDPDTLLVRKFQLFHQSDELTIGAPNAEGVARFSLNGSDTLLYFQNNLARLPYATSARGHLLLLRPAAGHPRLFHLSKRPDGSTRIRNLPLWLSILPPLIAIAMALVFKEVVVSLFVGIWAGAFIAGGLRVDSLYYLILSVLEVVEKYVINALNDSGHLSVIVFSLMIGGMVAIISRNGGMAGVVNSLSRFARTARSSQFVTWLLGIAIFFDDYANTLIVGNTMRSVTDKFRISREKLAYIVDSTAAPVSAVAFITTWIGAELGYIDSGLRMLEGFSADLTPYAIFLKSLKYSFYPGLTLVFILLLIWFRRDYGPMFQAEIRARKTGVVALKTAAEKADGELENLDPVEGAPYLWYNAAIPVLLVIFLTVFGLIDTGIAATYRELAENGLRPASSSWVDVWAAMGGLLEEGSVTFIRKIGKLIGNADSYVSLLWASFSGVLAALLLTIGQRIMQLADSINTLITGFKTMFPALIILILAWALATTTEELHTAQYLTIALEGSLDPHMIPVVIFLLAAFISFSTGSSWSTMAILYPIAIPTTWAICHASGMDDGMSLEILLNSIAVTLGASVLGDHCSPISDTTILSSLASDCNHIEHVRTQLPYALTVGAVSLVNCWLATYLGGSWMISTILFFAGVALLTGVLLRFGKPTGDLENG